MTTVGDILDALAYRTRPDRRTNDRNRPRVSIGLAVWNGERYLAEAIESILAQTYRDFELIICDNASTDRTAEICETYSMRDDRVRVWRNDRNIGGVNNENLTFRLARGEFFRLAAHDDVCEPTLLERCVAALDADVDAVVAYTATIDIDDRGEVLRVTRLAKGTAAGAARRFRDFPSRDHNSEVTYGLMRASAVRRARPQGSYGHADRVWLSELALAGRFVAIDEPLFRKRYHERNAYVDIRARSRWFRPWRRDRMALPYWAELVGYVGAVRDSDAGRVTKLRCAVTIAGWAVRYSPNLGKDVVIAALTLIGIGRLDDPRRLNWA